ncbi:MAG: hypothetical protein KF754_01015 [Planctomycetes bacterium]|nr:hypothetical protein [Planctomycetota bacterium]
MTDATPQTPPRLPPIVRHDVAVLASGYTLGQHRLNVLALVLFGATCIWVGQHVLSRPLGALTVFLAVLGAWLLTDFLSGLIHWAGDTWGRVSMPVVGRMLVRTFREHHTSPRAITHHGVVQLLGEQSLFATPLMGLLLLFNPDDQDVVGTTTLLGLYFMLVVITASNLFHKWAHMRKPPVVARVMQNLGLVISFKHHARHHAPPYMRGYCPAIGWLNPVLDGIRFWRGLEWLVWKCTGVLPREDDLGREAALALMRPAGQPTR